MKVRVEYPIPTLEVFIIERDTNMTKDATKMDVESIPLNLIDPPQWDSRLEKTGAAAKQEVIDIGEMGESLRTEGQLQPIKVFTKDNGRYERIIGGRRCKGALAIGWTHINAIVVAAPDPADRIVQNIIENEQRKPLTSFEQARACLKLRELGMKGDQVAEKVKFSKQRISHLCSMMQKLPAPILKDWEGDGEAVNVHTLYGLTVDKDLKTDDDRVAAWERHKASVAKVNSEPKTRAKRGKGGKGGKSANLNGEAYRVLLAFCGDKKSGKAINVEPTKSWLYQVVCYLTGARPGYPDGVFDPTIKTIKEEEAEAAAKAKKRGGK